MKTMNTKKALIASLLSLVLCVSMLVGSTFAWFTDTASTGVNRITSGNLHVEIQDESGNKLTKLEWKASDGRTQDQILWEPGCTYTLTPFKIVNTGNLALKYKLVVTGLDGDSELLNVIRFTYKIGTEDFALNEEGHLAANGGATGLITVSATMASDAGNEYMGKTLDNVKFTVYATQDTVENDSFGNRYDQFATYAPSGEMYTVTNYEEAKRAFAAGGGIVINDYIEGDATKTAVSDRLVIKYPSVLDLNAPVHIPGELEASANWAVFYINADTTINASSGGGILCANKLNPGEGAYNGGPYVAHVAGEGIVVTVNGGTYHGGGTVFNVQMGTLIVNGGFFQVTPDVDTNDYRYTLNCIDANYKNGTAKIIVKGGTFVNFDPSNNLAEGAGTNFVADGYHVVSETQANGDIWYTVVAD
jgi:hypothetical protein